MRFHLSLLLGLSLFFSVCALADPTDALYASIANDLGHDVNEMGPSLGLNAQQQQNFASDWQAFLADPTKPNPLASVGLDKQNLWPPAALSNTTAPTLDSSIRSLKVPKLNATMPSSIKNMDDYAADRLGPGLSAAVKAQKVSVQVYGGSSESLATKMAKENRVLKRIPSLYEKWGIEKFLDITPGQPPRVIIHVPPIQQYVEHYAAVVEADGGKLDSVLMNETDRAAYRNEAHVAVAKLFAQSPNKVDDAVLGYAPRWAETLQSPDSIYNVSSSQNIQGTDGLSATVYQLESKTNPSVKRTLMVISNEKTMWGEGTTFIAEGILKQKPKNFVFLGSAGAPDPAINVYDVTVPQTFTTHGHTINVTNGADATRPAAALNTQASNGTTIRYGIKHGNTDSPAEETKKFITYASHEGVNTMDVEQSLVARAVAASNQGSKNPVNFIALNVVTDKPSSFTHDYTALNLDQVNVADKIKAQNAAVQIAQQAILEEATHAAAPVAAANTTVNAATSVVNHAVTTPATVIANTTTSNLTSNTVALTAQAPAVPAPTAPPTVTVVPVPTPAPVPGAVTDADRIAAVHKQFPNVDVKQISIVKGQGKIEVDLENKFSYYIFTKNPNDPTSPTLLIPMSTSRFDKYNYSTNEWWTAHQQEIQQAQINHTQMPKQNPQEVEAYLKKMGLSTNPDMFTLDVKAGTSSKMSLQDFLMQDYLTRFSDGKDVYLYRGAINTEELGAWKSAAQTQLPPHGARYWTPDEDYGWRYGRKDSGFLQGLVDDTTPVLRFKVPLQQFQQLVKNGDLILGTEITKSAHDSFDATGRYEDALTGYDYMGDGKYGLDWEIRARSRGRAAMVQAFDGVSSVDDLAKIRVQRIHEATDRIILADPSRTAELRATETKRVAQVQSEVDLIHAIQQKKPVAEVQALLAKVEEGTEEITNSTDYLPSFVQDYVDNFGKTPAEIAAAAAAKQAAFNLSCQQAFADLHAAPAGAAPVVAPTITK